MVRLQYMTVLKLTFRRNNMKTLKERAKEQYKGWKKPTKKGA